MKQMLIYLALTAGPLTGGVVTLVSLVSLIWRQVFRQSMSFG